MQVFVGLPDHARRVFAAPDQPVVVVPEHEHGRLVLVDQVHPRVDVGQYILSPFLVRGARPEPPEIPGIAQMDAVFRAEIRDEIPYE
jgi:hypothetical protein